jgi:hypothetical protein
LWKSQKSQRAKSDEYGGQSIIMCLLARHSRTLAATRGVAVMMENQLVAPEFGSLPPNWFSYSVLLQLVSRLIFDLCSSYSVE